MPPTRNNIPIALDPELKAIFGEELVKSLESWDRDNIPGALQQSPEHSGITDEDIQNFVSQRIGRIGPAPLNSGQQPRPPQFQAGQTGRPPAGGLEAEGKIENPTISPPPPTGENSPTSEEIEGEIDYSQFIDVEGQEEGQEPEGSPEEFFTLDDQQIPLDTIRAYQNFNARLKSDPRLAQILTTYAETGRIPPELAGIEIPVISQPQPGAVSEVPPAQPPVSPPLFSIPEGYEDDPVIQSVLPAIQAQSQQIQQLTQLVQFQQKQQSDRQAAEQQALINRGVASFQQQHNLNDEQITRLRMTAGRIPIVDTYLQTGIDPRTGLPTTPDPLTAIETALDIAYWASPEFRQHEINRQDALRKSDAERKRKAGALSGNSGSAPRTQPAARPGTPEARQQMLSDLSAMMNGTFTES